MDSGKAVVILFVADFDCSLVRQDRPRGDVTRRFKTSQCLLSRHIPECTAHIRLHASFRYSGVEGGCPLCETIVVFCAYSDEGDETFQRFAESVQMAQRERQIGRLFP